jgi:hypothetical protein
VQATNTAWSTPASWDWQYLEKVKYDIGDTTSGYVADKFVAGTGIGLAEWTWVDENKLKITNSAPDQTVAITSTGIADVTWTYPNFNVDVPNPFLRDPVDDWRDPTGWLPPAPSDWDRYWADWSGSGWTDWYIYEWDEDAWVWIESIPTEWIMFWMIAELLFYVFFSGGWMEAGEFSFVKLDQTTPQTFTGWTLTWTGLLNVTAWQLWLDTNTYLTAETDPVFWAWLAWPPNVSIFTNDAWYITSSTPGGNDTEVQFNDWWAFAGDANFTYDKTKGFLDVGLLNNIQIGDEAGNCLKDVVGTAADGHVLLVIKQVQNNFLVMIVLILI